MDGERAVGEQLRQAREARGWSLEEVAQATRIRLRYLRALEDGDWASLPPRVYAIGFLKLYARQLGLDPNALLAVLPPVSPPPPAVSEEEPQAPAAPVRAAPPAPAVPRTGRRARRAASSAPEGSSVGWAFVVIVLAAAFVAGLWLLHHRSAAVTAPAPRRAVHHIHTGSRPPARRSKSTSPSRHHSHSTLPAPRLSAASSTTLAYTVPSGPVTVTLAFSGRCWVEEWINGVNQGAGGTIYTSGQTLTVRATQSLAFFVGNPGVAAITINGYPEGLLSQGTAGGPRTLSVTVSGG